MRNRAEQTDNMEGCGKRCLDGLVKNYLCLFDFSTSLYLSSESEQCHFITSLHFFSMQAVLQAPWVPVSKWWTLTQSWMRLGGGPHTVPTACSNRRARSAWNSPPQTDLVPDQESPSPDALDHEPPDLEASELNVNPSNNHVLGGSKVSLLPRDREPVCVNTACAMCQPHKGFTVF